MRRALVIAAVILAGPALLRAGSLFENAEQTLKSQGFYNGPVDGQKSDELTAAIRRYQIRNGLKVSGELDVDTQRALGLTGAPPPRPTATLTPPPGGYRDATTVGPTQPVATPTAPPPPNDSLQEEQTATPPDSAAPASADLFAGTRYAEASPMVQQRMIAGAQYELMRAGFYRGGVDGIYGPATSSALRAYQAETNLAPSGRFDTPTLRALGLIGGNWRRIPRRPVAPRIYRGQWVPE